MKKKELMSTEKRLHFLESDLKQLDHDDHRITQLVVSVLDIKEHLGFKSSRPREKNGKMIHKAKNWFNNEIWSAKLIVEMWSDGEVFISGTSEKRPPAGRLQAQEHRRGGGLAGELHEDVALIREADVVSAAGEEVVSWLEKIDFWVHRIDPEWAHDNGYKGFCYTTTHSS